MERGFDNMIEALERDEKKAKAIHELSPERQALVEQREQQTDKVYQLRTQLASFLRSNRAALYDVYGEPWETGKHALEILAELAEARANGRSIEETLKIKVNRRDRGQYKLLAVLNRALDVYAELKSVADPAGLKEDGSDAAQIDRYYKMRFGNIGQAMWVRDEMNEQAQRLQKEREEVMKTSSDPDVLEAIDEDMADLQRRADVYFSSNPEAWITARAMRLYEMKKTFDENGRIVQTPYVREKMAEIQASIKVGRPVFIYGELGSGKTEIAKELAYQKLSLPHLKRWDALHPEPDLLDKEAHDTWLAQRREQREAIVAVGHRSIEIEALLAGREVRRKETPLPEEQLGHMRRAWKSYAEKMGIAGTDQETREREIFEKVYIEFFRTPIETNVVLGGLLQAMREGRPFILDEMNAVPHMILIAFNDLLMRKPGDLVQVPVPGAVPFRAQEGFCFIGTGNYKPEDGKRYVGRQQLDAAFLSRLDTVSYDYLPMSIETGSQEDFEKNELFHMLVARLIDRDLSVRIPEGALEKIKGICRAARILQNVISDRAVSEKFYPTRNGSKVKPSDVLQENVLSIRHLIPIIDTWKKSGYTQSLEDLLYARYVSKSDARPEEKSYIYWTLQTMGEVFPPSEGWPDATAENALQGFQGVQKRIYGEHAYTGGAIQGEKREAKLKYYSPKALVEIMYGAAPARKQIDEEVFETRKKGKMLSPEAQLHIGNAMDQIRSLFAKLVEAGEFAGA